jgi:ribosomal-protein-alanine N-acetyltransferase
MRNTIDTSRLFMHPLQTMDFDVVYAIFTDKFVRKYLCDDQILSPEQVREFMQTSDQTFDIHGYGLYLLHEKSTDQVVGLAGLWSFFDEPQPQLLYVLLPAFTGKGYATEVAIALLRFGFIELSFPYIDASFDELNVTSRRVAERLGMTYLKRDVVNGNPILFYRKETTAVA